MSSNTTVLSKQTNPHLPLNVTVGQDLKLSILDGNDTEEVFAVINRNRTHLRKWLPWVDSITSAEKEQVFILGSYDSFDKNTKAVYGIRYNGHTIGIVGIPWIDWESKECAMAYWIDATFAGRGFVTRCCKELLKTCFEHLHLARVILQVSFNNQKSRAVAKRIGMRIEGVMEDKWKTLWRLEGFAGPYACDIQYAISYSEWKASQ